MSEEAQSSPEISAQDIVFDCPRCGQSLAIDPLGAGLIIACPGCRDPVQVPGVPRSAPGESHDMDTMGVALISEPASGRDHAAREDLAEELEAAHAKIARLVESLEEVRGRRSHLEKLRSTHIARFRQIGKEMENIQHAMNRIKGLLQDASAETQ